MKHELCIAVLTTLSCVFFKWKKQCFYCYFALWYMDFLKNKNKTASNVNVSFKSNQNKRTERTEQ